MKKKEQSYFWTLWYNFWGCFCLFFGFFSAVAAVGLYNHRSNGWYVLGCVFLSAILFICREMCSRRWHKLLGGASYH